jgi:hypothetical protein
MAAGTRFGKYEIVGPLGAGGIGRGVEDARYDAQAGRGAEGAGCGHFYGIVDSEDWRRLLES